MSDPGLAELRQELRVEIQASAAETRQQIQASEERTRQHIEAAEERSRRYADAQTADTRQHIEAAEDRTRQHVDAVTAELRGRVDTFEATVRQHSDDARRHFDVVAEGLMSKIELVAEGVVGLDQKMERFRADVRDEFSKVDRRLLRLEARVIRGPRRR